MPRMVPDEDRLVVIIARLHREQRLTLQTFADSWTLASVRQCARP
jgi:hypothetical protein